MTKTTAPAAKDHKTEATVLITKILLDFGPGYHPDTDIDDYQPLLDSTQRGQLIYVNQTFKERFTEEEVYTIVSTVQDLLINY